LERLGSSPEILGGLSPAHNLNGLDLVALDDRKNDIHSLMDVAEDRI